MCVTCVYRFAAVSIELSYVFEAMQGNKVIMYIHISDRCHSLDTAHEVISSCRSRCENRLRTSSLDCVTSSSVLELLTLVLLEKSVAAEATIIAVSFLFLLL